MCHIKLETLSLIWLMQ